MASDDDQEAPVVELKSAKLERVKRDHEQGKAWRFAHFELDSPIRVGLLDDHTVCIVTHPGTNDGIVMDLDTATELGVELIEHAALARQALEDEDQDGPDGGAA